MQIPGKKRGVREGELKNRSIRRKVETTFAKRKHRKCRYPGSKKTVINPYRTCTAEPADGIPKDAHIQNSARLSASRLHATETPKN
jgi:hypothetical protein